MEVALQMTLSNDFNNTNKNYSLDKLSKSLEQFFNSKNYGDSILSYTIGITCVRHEFDPFFKERRPKYTEDRVCSYLGLSPIRIIKSFEFTIKLDYDFYRYSKPKEGEIYVVNEIINRVKSLKYPKKITDFSRKEFEKDLESYFKEKGLL